MIGPGTGIAPFRSFLWERDAIGAEGRNWLFFGDRNFVSDFIYQAELQDFLKTGSLTHLDLAFSRDTEEKVYVQHKLEQKAQEVFYWLEGGASVYVCGTKDPMSRDVEKPFYKLFSIKENKVKKKLLIIWKRWSLMADMLKMFIKKSTVPLKENNYEP
jgi:sulfite reductase (NADPH) flavoprotein alpha-component